MSTTNNAFFARQIVMSPRHHLHCRGQMDKPDSLHKEILTRGIPIGNDGNWCRACWRFPHHHPQGSKNVDAAKGCCVISFSGEHDAYLKETRAPICCHDLIVRTIRTGPTEGPHARLRWIWGCQADVRVDGPTTPPIRAVLSEQIGRSGNQYHAKQHDPAQATEERPNGSSSCFEQYQK